MNHTDRKQRLGAALTEVSPALSAHQDYSKVNHPFRLIDDTTLLHGIAWGNLDQILNVVDEVVEPQDFESPKLGLGGLLSETEIALHLIDPTDLDRLCWRRFDDALGKHGLVSWILAAADLQKGEEA